MTRPATHRLDIYGVELSLATTPKAWASLVRRLPGLDAETPDSAGLSTFGIWTPVDGPPTPHLVVWVDVGAHRSLGGLVDTLAHEASHGAGQVLAFIGHDYAATGGADEPHAYLAGWLARWLFDHTDHTGLA